MAQQTENHQREQTVISKTTEAENVDARQSVSEVAWEIPKAQIRKPHR